ncbi:MAG: ribosome silencing factor [Verrucomicrobia bacterium]|nr:ribosome silencing factor [Verrucomicrobiota bacterium]
MEPTPLTSLDLARRCRELALDRKAEDIVLLDLRGISSICDFFLVCTGTAEPHLKAVATSIETGLKELGHRPRGRDGLSSTNWMVLDYSDVLIHIFRRDTRSRYALEQLWGDAKKVE